MTSSENQFNHDNQDQNTPKSPDADHREPRRMGRPFERRDKPFRGTRRDDPRPQRPRRSFPDKRNQENGTQTKAEDGSWTPDRRDRKPWDDDRNRRDDSRRPRPHFHDRNERPGQDRPRKPFRFHRDEQQQDNPETWQKTEASADGNSWKPMQDRPRKPWDRERTFNREDRPRKPWDRERTFSREDRPRKPWDRERTFDREDRPRRPWDGERKFDREDGLETAERHDTPRRFQRDDDGQEKQGNSQDRPFFEERPPRERPIYDAWNPRPKYEPEPEPDLPYARKHRITVFGGSFDPIHNGHIMLAQKLIEKDLTDEVLFVPARIQPLKQDGPTATPQQRLDMLKLALDPYPKFSFSDIEIQRTGELSYTFDTMTTLKQVFMDCDLSILIGMDSLLTLQDWYRAAELVQRFQFLIYPRPGINCPSLIALDKAFGLRNAYKLKNSILPEEDFQLSEASSTTIRENQARHKRVEDMLPEAVAAYIQQNKLYQ